MNTETRGPKCRTQTQFYGSGIDHALHCERAQITGEESFNLSLERDLFGCKPQLLARLVAGSWNPTTVSQVMVALGGAEQGGTGLPPYPAETTVVRLHGGNGDDIYLDQEQGRLIAQAGLEVGHAGGGAS